MQTSSSELKKQAKRVLKGNYGLCVGAQCIMFSVVIAFMVFNFFIMFFIGMSAYGTGEDYLGMIIWLIVYIFSYIVMILVLGLLWPGSVKIYLNLCTNQPARLSDLFFSFRSKPHKFLGLYFIEVGLGIIFFIPYFVVLIVSIITDYIPIMMVLLALMYLVGIIGCIIVRLYLSQAILNLIESPDKKVFASIKKSVEMMKGNKGRLFYIYISFIGMVLLGYGSCLIGFLWIGPYIQCTLTGFYLDLKARQEQFTCTYYDDNSFESMLKQENHY